MWPRKPQCTVACSFKDEEQKETQAEAREPQDPKAKRANQEGQAKRPK